MRRFFPDRGCKRNQRNVKNTIQQWGHETKDLIAEEVKCTCGGSAIVAFFEARSHFPLLLGNHVQTMKSQGAMGPTYWQRINVSGHCRELFTQKGKKNRKVRKAAHMIATGGSGKIVDQFQDLAEVDGWGKKERSKKKAKAGATNE